MGFLASEAREVLEAVIGARPDYRFVIQEQAKRDMAEGVRRRLAALYGDAVARRQLRGRAPVRSGAELFEELPMLSAFDQAIKRNSKESLLEFLDNVQAHRDETSNRFFGGAPITSIESLTGMTGDAHNHGRRVFGVRTNVGTFYYKPHDCRIEAMYHELAGRFFSDCTAAADCVLGDGCGFIPEIVAAPLESMDALHDYYRNVGKLTALLHGIGGWDIHHENIVPCKELPVAVDLETVLAPQERPRDRMGEARSRHKAKGPVVSDVRNTGILPIYIAKVGLISPLHPFRGDDSFLPFVDDRHYSIEGHEEDFIAGFEEGYRRVLANTGEIKALLASYKDAQVRFARFNTAYYAHLLGCLFRETNLRSREAQERVLEKLEVPYRARGLGEEPAVVAHERRCLLEGDIPYFCTTLDGTALCGFTPKEVIREEYMEWSAMGRALRSLDRLGEADLIYERDIARQTLRMSPTSEDEEKGMHPLSSQVPQKELVANVLVAVARDIEGGVVYAPDGTLCWPSVIPFVYGYSRMCGNEVLAADAGRCLAWIKATGVASKNAEQLEYLIRTCTNSVAGMVSEWEEEDASYLRLTRPLNVSLGIGAVVLACDDMARAGISEAAAIFRRLIGLLDKGEFYAAEKAEGMEELLCALARSRTEASEKTHLMKRLGERLLEEASATEGGVIFLASRGLAFASAFRLTGDGRFSEAAGKDFSEVVSRFDERLLGWPDESSPVPWLASRGTQAARLLICGMSACEMLAGRAGRAHAHTLVRLSRDALLSEDALWYDDSLRHGNSLAVVALMQAARELNDPACWERAESILAAMLERREHKGAFTIYPKNVRSPFDASFAFGTTGIAAALAAWYMDGVGLGDGQELGRFA